jgi:hypothetical protein
MARKARAEVEGGLCHMILQRHRIGAAGVLGKLRLLSQSFGTKECQDDNTVRIPKGILMLARPDQF